MKKPKRSQIMQQIISEIGLTASKKTSGYFTRNQLLELLNILRNHKLSENNLERGDKLNDRIETSSSN